jgi:hypothetical protein
LRKIQHFSAKQIRGKLSHFTLQKVKETTIYVKCGKAPEPTSLDSQAIGEILREIGLPKRSQKRISGVYTLSQKDSRFVETSHKGYAFAGALLLQPTKPPTLRGPDLLCALPIILFVIGYRYETKLPDKKHPLYPIIKSLLVRRFDARLGRYHHPKKFHFSGTLAV